MRKITLIVMVVLIGTTMSMAQNRGGQRDFNPEDMAKRQTELYKTELNLDDAQAEKIEKVLLASNKEMMAMRQEMQNEEDRTKIREKMTELRANREKEIKEILNEEQFEKYQKLMEERRSRRGGGPGSS